MRIRITLKLWRQYKDEHLKKVLDYEKKGIMNYESSIDDMPERIMPLTKKIEDSDK